MHAHRRTSIWQLVLYPYVVVAPPDANDPPLGWPSTSDQFRLRVGMVEELHRYSQQVTVLWLESDGKSIDTARFGPATREQPGGEPPRSRIALSTILTTFHRFTRDHRLSVRAQRQVGEELLRKEEEGQGRASDQRFAAAFFDMYHDLGYEYAGAWDRLFLPQRTLG